MNPAAECASRTYLARRRTNELKGFFGLIVFCGAAVLSVDFLDIPVERMTNMFSPLWRMLSDRLLPPDLSYVADRKVLISIVETIEMSVLGSLIGLLISLPLAWFAAWNVTPSRPYLYPLARGILVFVRAVPILMWAMVLVTIFGFGPFAGTLAIAKFTIGFAGKLMAEQLEAIDMAPIEALQATGAGKLAVFLYGALPQVKPAWAGIMIYNWDSAFRASSILGFVGAGGMGLYLRSAIQVLEYKSAMGIITVIVALVVLSEIFSHYVRGRLR